MDSNSIVSELKRIDRLYDPEPGLDPEPVTDLEPVTDPDPVTDPEGPDEESRKTARPANVPAAGRTRRKKKASSKSSTGAGKRNITIYVVEILAVLAAVCCVIGYLLWDHSFARISLQDYTSVTLDGYDGYGNADIRIDVTPSYPDFWDSVVAVPDRTQSLSNSDTITISYVYDEEAARANRIKVDDTEYSYVVETLAEPVKIDDGMLFSGLNVVQEGLSPKVALSVENISEDPFVSGVEYVIDTDKIFFTDGEEVPIRAQIPPESLESHEYVLECSDVFTYKVSEPARYIMDASYITPEVLASLEKEGLDLLLNSDANEYGLRIFQQEAHIQAQFVGNKTTFGWTGAYLISAYFRSVTDEGLQVIENHTNDVRLVYGVTIKQQNGASAFAEAVVQFTNLYLTEDGTLDLNIESGRLVSCTYRDKNVKELVNDDGDSSYNTTKLTS